MVISFYFFTVLFFFLWSEGGGYLAVKGNHYSVPDLLIGQLGIVKPYSDRPTFSEYSQS